MVSPPSPRAHTRPGAAPGALPARQQPGLSAPVTCRRGQPVFVLVSVLETLLTPPLLFGQDTVDR